MAKKDIKNTPDTVENTPESGVVVRESGITVNENVFQPKVLPLIVNLPPDASKAQIERAKILNAYAYAQPKGWEQKKERLIKELEDLKNAPDPVEDPNAPKLSVGTPVRSGLSE